ncbi:MAG TPA: zf-HC2 domain-containing protein [Gemmatimonadales bacterium]|nr:zf-HC2 domain-containing protein [Gemmatimonadales bacterium]
MTVPIEPPHLEPHEVVAYIERTLPAPKRARVEDHLSQCEECTAELAAVVRLRPRPARRAPWIPIGVAAAAVVAGLLVARPLLHRPAPAGDVERQAQAAPHLEIVAPAAGGRVTGAVTLVWRAAPGASVYRVTVSRADGDSVWAGSTTDTALAIPANVALARSAPYYWYVDALLADGRAVSTGVHEFTTGP